MHGNILWNELIWSWGIESVCGHGSTIGVTQSLHNLDIQYNIVHNDKDSYCVNDSRSTTSGP